MFSQVPKEHPFRDRDHAPRPLGVDFELSFIEVDGTSQVLQKLDRLPGAHAWQDSRQMGRLLPELNVNRSKQQALPFRFWPLW
jgi:hypothetical protein